MTPEIAFALLVATASATADTLDSHGHAPPAMVDRLRSEVVRKRARITTGLTRYDVRVGRLDGVGLGGFKTIGPSAHPPDPIAWPSVVRIDAVHTKTLLGMGIGTALSTSLALLFNADPNALVSMILAGALVGQQVGTRITNDEPVYVAQLRTTSPPPAAVAPAAAMPAAVAPAIVPYVIDDARVDKACAQIHRDRLLRVTFNDMPRVEGYALRANREGLHSLQPKEPSASSGALPDVISWNRISTVDGRGSRAGSFAIAGAVSVGVLGAILGAGLGAYGGGTGGTTAGGAAIGALCGAGIGGLFGSLFGAPIPAWHVVY